MTDLKKTTDKHLSPEELLVPESERRAYHVFKNRFNRKLVLFFLILGALAIVSLVFLLLTHDRLQLSQNPLIQRFIPAYHSLRKLPDILFIPYYFKPTALPVYELSIGIDGIQRLNRSLPRNPFGSDSLNNLERVFVPGQFRAEGYDDTVDVRYRGSLADHWNALQKSYRIEFPNRNLFEGVRDLNLIIPSNRLYFATSLNLYRSKKLGLITPDDRHVRLFLNGSDHGVYLWWEQWGQAWLEKKPVSSLSTMLGTRTDEGLSAGDLQWQSWNKEGESFDELTAFLEIVEHTTDEDFEKLAPHILDIDKMCALRTLNILAQSNHNYATNLVLIYNATTGLFEPVVNHLGLFEAPRSEPDFFMKRLIRVPAFRDRCDALFDVYVQKEREDDIAFVDAWIERMKPEFFKDTAKLENNFMFLDWINELRVTFENNFNDPSKMRERVYDIEVPETTSLSLPDSFAYLSDIVRSPHSFAAAHEGVTFERTTFRIGPGVHTVRGTMIVPAGYELVIAPGTTLLMEPDASLISYSPIRAIGTALRPIVVRGATSAPWGVVAVFNTKKESTFSQTTFEGGGEALLGGVPISGMLAAHGAPISISQSAFVRAHGDDAVNVKGARGVITNTVFRNNDFDAIDMDFVADDSRIADNDFYENDGENGDAIDISWSDFLIKDNYIFGCGDKGVSVGERSRPTLAHNRITECTIGVAVKDSSDATLSGNVFERNETAVALYRKKDFFEGGRATLKDNAFYQNAERIMSDPLSVLFESGSILLEDAAELEAYVEVLRKKSRPQL